MSNITRLILIDLDNFTPKQLDQILTFYTKTTKFVVFGLGERYTKQYPHLHGNRSKIEVLNNCFRFHEDQIEFQLTTTQIADAADMKMFRYVGERINDWTDINEVIIASNDDEWFNLAIMLQPQFNTRMILTAGKHSNRAIHARKIGINIPTIILKTKKDSK
jgi:hypothetical protein